MTRSIPSAVAKMIPCGVVSSWIRVVRPGERRDIAGKMLTVFVVLLFHIAWRDRWFYAREYLRLESMVLGGSQE